MIRSPGRSEGFGPLTHSLTKLLQPFCTTLALVPLHPLLHLHAEILDAVGLAGVHALLHPLTKLLHAVGAIVALALLQPLAKHLDALGPNSTGQEATDPATQARPARHGLTAPGTPLREHAGHPAAMTPLTSHGLTAPGIPLREHAGHTTAMTPLTPHGLATPRTALRGHAGHTAAMTPLTSHGLATPRTALRGHAGHTTAMTPLTSHGLTAPRTALREHAGHTAAMTLLTSHGLTAPRAALPAHGVHAGAASAAVLHEFPPRESPAFSAFEPLSVVGSTPLAAISRPVSISGIRRLGYLLHGLLDILGLLLLREGLARQQSQGCQNQQCHDCSFHGVNPPSVAFLIYRICPVLLLSDSWKPPLSPEVSLICSVRSHLKKIPDLL